jgi:hypothetical protein
MPGYKSGEGHAAPHAPAQNGQICVHVRKLKTGGWRAQKLRQSSESCKSDGLCQCVNASRYLVPKAARSVRVGMPKAAMHSSAFAHRVRILRLADGAREGHRPNHAARSRRQSVAEAASTPDAVTSVVPMAFVLLQTTAVWAACASSFALSPTHTLSAPKPAARGIGLMLAAGTMHALQLTLGVRRGAENVAALFALTLSSTALGCAAAAIVHQAQSAHAVRDARVAAALWAVSWLSLGVALGMQLERDELVWGTTPKPFCAPRARAALAALGGTGALMAIGSVAHLRPPDPDGGVHPLGAASAVLALSMLPAAIGARGALARIES